MWIILLAAGVWYVLLQNDRNRITWIENAQERLEKLHGYSASNFQLNTALTMYAPTKGIQDCYATGDTYSRRIRARSKTNAMDPNVRREGVSEIVNLNYRKGGSIGYSNLSYIKNV
jgi:hypothetical protein